MGKCLILKSLGRKLLFKQNFGLIFTCTTLWANSAEDKLMVFSYFPRKQHSIFRLQENYSEMLSSENFMRNAKH